MIDQLFTVKLINRIQIILANIWSCNHDYGITEISHFVKARHLPLFHATVNVVNVAVILDIDFLDILEK